MYALKKQFLGVFVGAAAICFGATAAMAYPTTTIDGITLPVGITGGGYTFSTQTLYENVVTAPNDVNVGAGTVGLIGPSSGGATYLYGQGGLYLNVIFSGFTVASITPPSATTAGQVAFTGGTVSFYVDNAFLDPSAYGSVAAVNNAIANTLNAVSPGTALLELTAEPTTALGYSIVATLPAGSATNEFSAIGSTGYFAVTGGDAASVILPDSFANPFSPTPIGTSSAYHAAVIFTSSDSTVCGINAYATVTNPDCVNQPDSSNPTGLEFVNGSGKSNWNTIPEPSTLALMGAGLLGLLFVSRRRSQKKAA